MDEIKVQYTVDQKAAVLAGQKFYGTVETTVDPAALTPEQRAELAQCDTDKGVFILNRYPQDVGEIRVGTRDDAHVVTLLNARITVRQEKKEKEEKERADNYARCAALLKSARRAEVLEKIVRGEKIGWVFPGTTQDAEKWWADHQAEFSGEMTAIRERIEREQQEEKQRIEAIVKQRAANVLAAGIDGILERNDDNEWQLTYYIGGDGMKQWEEREHSAVLALIAQAKAEAARRNESEKTARQDQINAWVAEKGTDNQKGRHALGLLPEDEILDALRDEAFASLESFPRYEKIKKDDLDHAEYCEAGITCDVSSADGLTEEEYDVFAEIQKSAPQGAGCSALSHDCECKECDAESSRKSVKVLLTVGAFTFTREYAL